MGMAACQARFLGITARKSACEYRSTEIAQRKAQVSEQLADISKDYANAMNATKLLWDNEHCDCMYGLTYNILMKPSAVNDYNPFFISTSKGALILSGPYAFAAQYAGISKTGGNNSEAGFKKFMNALRQDPDLATSSEGMKTLDMKSDEIISENALKDVLKVKYNERAGIGGKPLEKEGIEICDIGTLCTSDALSKKLFVGTQVYNDDGTPKQKDGKDVYEADHLLDVLNTEKSGNIVTEANSNLYTVIKGSTATISDLEDISVSDLLHNDIYVYSTYPKTSTNAEGKNKTNAQRLYEDIVEPVLNKIALTFGYDYDSSHKLREGTGLWVDDASKSALRKAYMMTKGKLKSSASNPYGKSSDSDRDRTDLNNNIENNFSKEGKNAPYDNAKKYIGIGQNKNGDESCISLSNIMDTFLTYFAQCISEDPNCPYMVGKSVETSTFVADDPGYSYIINSSPVKYTQAEKLADFYHQLYNNICLHGWRTDDSILDEQSLEAALKDGRYTLNSLNNDGMFYQTPYTQTGYMKEITDNDAIARAEAEFAQKKAELSSMEDRLDVNLKQVDAEIAELNAEYEAVKNLISKNVEKTFQMYSN